jgi:glycosyltransferase involved in cell wall biosynthesis
MRTSPDNYPTISVIVPAYHSGRTIQECLDSILAQTHPPQQIIVVDDQSTDDTVQQIRQWNARHGNMAQLIVMPENKGPASARNAGLDAAACDWIAFLDADDAWLPWRLEKQLAVLQQHPDAMFICAQTMDLDTSTPDDANVPWTSAVPEILNLEKMLDHNPVATSTVLVRRSTVKACGGFDSSFRGPEDYDLWLRILANGEGLYLPLIVSRYRTTVGSLSMDDRTFLPEVLRVLAKAFSQGGVLFPYRHLRRRARAQQYASASWMAFNRGDRFRSLSLLLRSWLCSPGKLTKEKHDPLQRAKLLLRYLSPQNSSQLH